MFKPIQIGNHTLKHRVVMAPLTRLRNSEDYTPLDIVPGYYEQRASEGGLLIGEACVISPKGSYPIIPGIFNQKQIDVWRKVTDTVHAKKAVIFCQLVHLGRSGKSEFMPNNEPPVGPSAIRITAPDLMGQVNEVPRALDQDGIQEIIQEFRQAALNAIEAGFDGVEIHGANGYLVDQFINSSSNQRTDKYGGSIENRARFPLEVLEAIVDAIGPERTSIRLSPGTTFQDMHDDSVVETWSYLTAEIKRRFPKLAYLHFIQTRSNMNDDSKRSVIHDSLEPYRNIWKGAFVSAGGFTNAEKQSIEYAEHTGDLIAFGRSFIANPDLPERLANDWELNRYDRPTFYTGGVNGYTDYPFYQKQEV